MRRVIAASALLLLTAAAPAAAEEVRAGDLVVSDPWVRATIGTLRMTAGYLTVRNEGNRDDRLLAVEIPEAGAVELHVTEDGKMREVESYEVPAGGTLEVAPAGNHLMLGPLAGPLTEGGTLEGTLVFEVAGEVPVTFTIERANALQPGD